MYRVFRHTRSGKPYKHKHGRKYWHYFLRMENHPKGWPLLYETPLGMFCLYGKVMGMQVRKRPKKPRANCKMVARQFSTRMSCILHRRRRAFGGALFDFSRANCLGDSAIHLRVERERERVGKICNKMRHLFKSTRGSLVWASNATRFYSGFGIYCIKI